MSKKAVDLAGIKEVLTTQLSGFNTEVRPAAAEGAIHISVTPLPKKTGPGVLKESDLEKIKGIIKKVKDTFGFPGHLEIHSPISTFATFTLGERSVLS